MEEVHFLQKDFYELNRGSALFKAEPTTEHLQAKTMLGGATYPGGYYKLLGDEDGEVFFIPHFEGYLDDHHPDAKELVGPFVPGKVTILGEDLLPKDAIAAVSFVANWPNLDAYVCINSDKEAGDKIKFPHPPPKCYNMDKFQGSIESKILNYTEVKQ